jgi:hypothetical protein
VDSFIVSLFIAWRLAGVLMDFALLISIVSAGVNTAAGSVKQNNTAPENRSPVIGWPLTECCY